MKTILSIPLIMLMLFTGISVKFATHYCGGFVSDTKISLTGELATCGMESDAESQTQQQTLRHHCCDNTLTAYSFCNTFFGSTYDVDNQEQQLINNIFIPVDYIIDSKININILNNHTKPPGYFNPNSVDRRVLCIFRI